MLLELRSLEFYRNADDSPKALTTVLLVLLLNSIHTLNTFLLVQEQKLILYSLATYKIRH